MLNHTSRKKLHGKESFLTDIDVVSCCISHTFNAKSLVKFGWFNTINGIRHSFHLQDKEIVVAAKNNNYSQDFVYANDSPPKQLQFNESVCHSCKDIWDIRLLLETKCFIFHIKTALIQ